MDRGFRARLRELCEESVCERGIPVRAQRNQEARETILRWLREILADDRGHRVIGADPTFSLRGLLPVPFQRVLARVSAKEEWPVESLMNAVFSNVGWLEHHHTRLREYPGEEHGRSPNIPCLHGMDPSARKSSSKEYCTSTLLALEEAPEFIRDGLATGTDGTVRGHRTSIVSYQRSGVVSDEVSNTYETPYSEQGKGIHYLGRSKLATYVNCERDTQVTGNGSVHLAGYSFVHHVWGQVPAVEYALRPTPGGFQKRFTIVFPGATRCEPDLPCSHSKALLLDFHRWMCRHAFPRAAFPSFDDRALTLFRCVRRAVDEFIDGAPGLSAYDVIKLKLADTDIIRMTNVAMRCNTFAEGLSGIATSGPQAGGFQARRRFSLFDLVYALRLWQRQLSLHLGYYRSSKEKTSRPMAVPRGTRSAPRPLCRTRPERPCREARAGGCSVAGGGRRRHHDVLRLGEESHGGAREHAEPRWGSQRCRARVVPERFAARRRRAERQPGEASQNIFYQRPAWSTIGDAGKARMAEFRISADAFED